MNRAAPENCVLCDGTDIDVLFDREFQVLLCKGCCLMFIGASDDTGLEEYYGKGYYFGIKRDRVDSISTRRRVKWLARHIGGARNKQVLEIGCGQGHLLRAIQDQGARVYGIEPSVPDGVLAGSLSGHENISIGMLADFNTDVRYDAVVLIHVFEHMPDPLAALQQIRSLLKPDGLLFIEVPNFYSTTGFYRKRKGVEAYPSPNHLFIYTPGTLIGMLRKNGFENISKAYNYHNMRLVFRPGQGRPAFKEPGVKVYKKVWFFFLVLKFMAGVKSLVYRLLRLFKHRRYVNPATRSK